EVPSRVGEAFERPCVAQPIEHNHVPIGVVQDVLGDVSPGETGPSGEQQSLPQALLPGKPTLLSMMTSGMESGPVVRAGTSMLVILPSVTTLPLGRGEGCSTPSIGERT